MDIVEEMRGFEIDHEPEGWPAVRMRQVSALCDEVERLRAEVAELDELREKMAGILSRTAVALRGPEPPLTRWSWHDLPERAAAAIAAIDVMQRAAVIAATDTPPNALAQGRAACGESLGAGGSAANDKEKANA